MANMTTAVMTKGVLVLEQERRNTTETVIVQGYNMTDAQMVELCNEVRELDYNMPPITVANIMRKTAARRGQRVFFERTVEALR
jgi:hypothetical protein